MGDGGVGASGTEMFGIAWLIDFWHFELLNYTIGLLACTRTIIENSHIRTK
jgi:hypothetical protein